MRPKKRNRSDWNKSDCHYLFKLMANKDEYAVARLYTSGDFEAKLKRQFEGGLKMKFHLAPPLLAKCDPDTGHLMKSEYGPWVFSAMKQWDLFGCTAECRAERAAIEDYLATLQELMTGLTPDNHALAREIAALPEKIRGFGHVKERHLAAFREEHAQLMETWHNPAERPSAAE